MELNDKDRKTLKVFCLMLRSRGSENALLDFNFYQDYPQQDRSFYSNNPYQNIEGFDEIYDLAEKITIPIIEDEIDYYESSGGVSFCVDCTEKLIFFKAHVYEMNTKNYSEEYDMSQLVDLKSFKDFVKSVGNSKTATVTYEGSGDLGYINSDVELSNGESSDDILSTELKEWLFNKLENFGGWEINEGSQGSFIFNFKDKKVYHEHGENYDESVDFAINTKIKF
jgi:hypothetical protein